MQKMEETVETDLKGSIHWLKSLTSLDETNLQQTKNLDRAERAHFEQIKEDRSIALDGNQKIPQRK